MQKLHRVLVVALVDGLPADRFGETIGLGIQGQLQGAQLSEGRPDRKFEGKDLALALHPKSLSSHLGDFLRLEARSKRLCETRLACGFGSHFMVANIFSVHGGAFAGGHCGQAPGQHLEPGLWRRSRKQRISG